jgi:signal transduction histidine kinase
MLDVSRSAPLPFDTIEQAALALLEAANADDVAKILLAVSLSRSGAMSGAVLLGDERSLTAVALRGPDQRAVSPALSAAEQALRLEKTVLSRFAEVGSSPLISTEPLSAFGSAKGPVSAMLLSLRDYEDRLGALYLERDDACECDPQTIGVLSMFARQAAASLGRLRLSEDLKKETLLRRDAEESCKEIYDSMIKHQRIGKMGDFRFNTRTLRSRGSSQCYAMFGYEPGTDIVEYDLWMEKLHPDDRRRVHEEMHAAFAKQIPLRFEYRIIIDGGIRHILSEGHPEFDRNGDLLYCGVVVDITEQKAVEDVFANMQAELSTALRLASLGELAGSVVHEVNQPLTAMVANADACRRWLAREPANIEEAREAADQVSHQGRRAAAVVSGLEALAKGAQIQLSKFCMAEMVADVLFLLKPQLERARVSVQTELDKAIQEIIGDRMQLQQVVFNLVRNAADAVKTIHDRPRILRISSWQSDGRVTVSFRDSGEGVEPERLDQMFNPLFTTKGEGLGLGLSICRRIVAAHHGRIWAERNNDDGLTVSFTIPIDQPPAKQ